MPALKVISVGSDPELLWLRNAALKSAGFDVESAEHHDHALAAIQRGDCGTLLICYSLKEPIRQMLANAFRNTVRRAALSRSQMSEWRNRISQTLSCTELRGRKR